MTGEADRRVKAGETVDYNIIKVNMNQPIGKKWLPAELEIVTPLLERNSHLSYTKQAELIQKALGTTYPRTLKTIKVSRL